MPNKIFHGQKNLLLFGLFMLSLVFFLMAKIIPSYETKSMREEMIAASQIMAEAMEILKDCREAKNLGLDSSFDVNRTGLSLIHI